jgi:predicted site-specific integrase-resolvase
MNYVKGMSKIRLTQWARKNGISVNTAIAWAIARRIKTEHPISGIWIIDDNEKRPKPMRPWANKRAGKFSRQ